MEPSASAPPLPPGPSKEAISFVTLHNPEVDAHPAGRGPAPDIVSHTCGMKIDILEEALLCNTPANEHVFASAPLQPPFYFFPPLTPPPTSHSSSDVPLRRTPPHSKYLKIRRTKTTTENQCSRCLLLFFFSLLRCGLKRPTFDILQVSGGIERTGKH